MEHKVYKLENSNPLVLTDECCFFKVLKGQAFIFEVSKARFHVVTCETDNYFFSLPPVDDKHFEVTGSLDAEIERYEIDEIKNFSNEQIINICIDMTSVFRQNRKLESQKFLKNKDFVEDIKNDLPTYCKNLAEILDSHRLKRENSEKNRIQLKDISSVNKLDESFRDLSSIIGSKKDNIEIQADDLLAKTVSFALSGQQIKVVPLFDKKYSFDEKGVNELSRDSNLRLRTVILKDDWYNKDNGPLVTFSCNENGEIINPIALIQKKGKYFIFDLAANTSKVVDRETVQSIYPRAFMFYETMPSTKLSILKVLSFSVEDIKSSVAVFFAFSFVVTLIGLFIPKITQEFMDRIIPSAAKDEILQILVLVLACTISTCFFEVVKQVALTRINLKSSTKLEASVLDRLLKMPVNFFRKCSSGELAKKTLSINSARELIVSTFLNSFATFVFSIIYFFQLNSYCSLLLKWGVLFSIIPILMSVAISLCRYKWDSKTNEIETKISGFLLQMLNGINKIVITNSENSAFSVWSKLFYQKKKFSYKSEYVMNILQTFNSAFTLTITLLFYFIFISAVKEQKIEGLSTGQFLAFMAAYGAFQSSLLSLTGSLLSTKDVIPLIKLSKDIFDEEPEIKESKPCVSHLSGKIELNHISFRYTESSPYVIDDLTLSIKPGEFVAIVGSSGCGKSTLIRLILGFEKCSSGAVFYDDQDLNSLDVGSVRRNMGVVLQGSTLMNSSIYENIVGSSGCTIDDAWKACEQVGIADDVREMPMNLHTVMSAGGGTISGGQRQRIIIARALVRNPSILIFDEATSALDNKSQKTVSDSLDKLNVTRIVIAHRLSTIVNADRILVLDKGRIIEEGTYNQLIEKGGFFYQLAKRQIE